MRTATDSLPAVGQPPVAPACGLAGEHVGGRVLSRLRADRSGTSRTGGADWLDLLVGLVALPTIATLAMFLRARVRAAAAARRGGDI